MKPVEPPALRLGVVAPTTNTVNEAEWRRLLPPHVQLVLNRMALHTDTDTAAGQQLLKRDLAQALQTLLAQQVDAIAYACTAGSMTTPHQALPDWMKQTCGKPCVTTAAAIVEALRALGVRRVAVATPYHDQLNQHETAFLQSAGFEVLSCLGLGIGAGGPHEYVRIAQHPAVQIEAHLRRAAHPDADALLVSCTDFPTLPLIPMLESELGMPVVSSNTATLWAILRNTHVKAAASGGRLFQEQSP